MKYDLIIGIDPDRDKSGVAFLKPKTRELKLTNLAFPQLLNTLYDIKKMVEQVDGQNVLVVVEAGWMVKKSNFHEYQGHRAEKIARDVGANHETGRKIVEMCKWYNLNVMEHAPLVKCWKGKDRKITQEELASFTGITGRNNQDARDAGLLAWEVSGLPIRIPSKC